MLLACLFGIGLVIVILIVVFLLLFMGSSRRDETLSPTSQLNQVNTSTLAHSIETELRKMESMTTYPVDVYLPRLQEYLHLIIHEFTHFSIPETEMARYDRLFSSLCAVVALLEYKRDHANASEIDEIIRTGLSAVKD